MTTDPLDLAVQALNDIPNTRFRQPIGPYRSTYELVAYLSEVARHSEEVMKADKEGRDLPTYSKVFMYFYPAPKPR
jgi:hypothetical protein